ncbi:hypothetical protein MmTuc01_2471 [Methanosarcina mazei Tuc01]|uniref:Uncharacterized protein n=1 Tax=Methanosarcina mazei Tuc01 TaxID=1236903 RepID=M1PZK4_METMZ|nr:hypothetical protein MmTuc01_2471 [Methanosarcina mazei Tuc01]
MKVQYYSGKDLEESISFLAGINIYYLTLLLRKNACFRQQISL